MNFLKRQKNLQTLCLQSLILLGGFAVVLFGVNFDDAQAAERTIAEVSTFDEFKSAAENVNISEIQVNASFELKSTIKLAQRDLVIQGNSDKGVILNSSRFSLQEGSLITKQNTLKLKNLKVVAMKNINSVPFVDTVNNWNLEIDTIDYDGLLLANVANGKISFDGTNKVHTEFENAKVRELIFAKGSRYDGVAADHSKYPAFRFNGNLVNGKASGTVDIQETAVVNLNVSPNFDADSYYYPEFDDKVYKIDVKEDASLTIESAGTAIQFRSRLGYVEAPSFNVYSNASVKINSQGGGAAPAINLDEPSTLNVHPNATFDVVGNSIKGVISAAGDTRITFDSPKFYNIQNRKERGFVFQNARKTIFIINNSDVNVWGKTGGDYLRDPDEAWKAVSLETLINDTTSSKTTSTSAELQQKFQTNQYGKISGGLSQPTYICPTLNPINDQDTMLTGTGNANLVIEAYVGERKIGETTVGADGRWNIHLTELLAEGKTVTIIQKDGDLVTCEPVEQIVSHLAAETVNFFKLGYWQEYGIVLEGSIDNADWDLSNSESIHKTIDVLDSNGGTRFQAEVVANTDWYQPGKYSGFQAIITGDQLMSLEAGEYKLQVGIQIDGTNVNEKNDFNTKNTTKLTSNTRYPGVYHQIYDEIETRDYGTKSVKTVAKGNVAYLIIEDK